VSIAVPRAVPRQSSGGSAPLTASWSARRSERETAAQGLGPQGGGDGPAARKPRWWAEVLLIGVLYGAYSCGRMLATGKVDEALDHGRKIFHIEQVLHIDVEGVLNSLLTRSAVLGVSCDFAYAALHYIITPVVLVWLWRRHPGRYRLARTWLAICTVLGLIGFTLLPTAPPRLLEHSYGFVDSMAQYASFGWWGADASAPRGLGGMTNEYAAMPSLHVGWALWCGVMIWRYGRSPVLRVLGLLYPLAIAFVVMGTANHYLLDAVAGACVMAVGYLLAPSGVRLADRLHAWWDGRRAASAGAGPDGETAAAGTSAAARTSARVADSGAGASAEEETGTVIPLQRAEGTGDLEPGRAVGS
jgi:PAP2 superfamily